MRFPFAERASLGCHAEFRPSAAPALAASACFVECLCVPFGTGFARCFAGGECFGWGCGEAGASEAVRSVAEAREHFGAISETSPSFFGPELFCHYFRKLNRGHENVMSKEPARISVGMAGSS